MDQLVLPEVAAGRTIQAVHILCLSVEVKMLFMSVGLSGDWGLGCVSCTGYMYANRYIDIDTSLEHKIRCFIVISLVFT